MNLSWRRKKVEKWDFVIHVTPFLFDSFPLFSPIQRDCHCLESTLLVSIRIGEGGREEERERECASVDTIKTIVSSFIPLFLQPQMMFERSPPSPLLFHPLSLSLLSLTSLSLFSYSVFPWLPLTVNSLHPFVHVVGVKILLPDFLPPFIWFLSRI